MDELGLAMLRSAMRKDLSSVGIIPTGAGIQLVAQRDQALGFALICEAVYVQLYNERSADDILSYLEGPLQVDDRLMRQYILRTALRVRAALTAAAGVRDAAVRSLMAEAGAEPAVVAGIVEACMRTAEEFSIPWTRVFFHGYRPRRSAAGRFGCLILAVGALALCYGFYLLIRHLIR